MAFSTPVLFLVFNRPEHTRRVFQQIRRIQPSRLFISADGSRAHVPGDVEKCQAVRAIVEMVDWNCRIETNFMAENLGCRRAVVQGISWFFEHVESGIILEDDCLPSEAFFGFCAAMLEKYKDDGEVWHISGSNPGVRYVPGKNSGYVFSRFPFVWGWASWRRAWDKYDPQFLGLEESWLDPSNGFRSISKDATARRYLFDKFLRTRAGEIDTWDYGWFYSILKNRGLCLNPATNLVSNIGFDQEATHTRKSRKAPVCAETNMLADCLQDPPHRNPQPALERAFFRQSQKNEFGLLLRRIVPQLFFKSLPARPALIWQRRFSMKINFSS